MLQGHLIDAIAWPTPTVFSCGVDCKGTDGCLWYSFDKVNEMCFLFSTCPGIDESAVNFISNQVGCSDHE